MRVTITDGVTTTLPGSLVSYQLNYANTQNQGATGVYLTQTLPVGTSFNAGASTPGWTEISAGVYRLNIGSLNYNTSGSVTFSVNVDSPALAGVGTLDTTVTIDDDGTNGFDRNPFDNTATDSNTLVAAPDLSVAITDNITSTTTGSQITYALNYANTGTQGATGVFLTQSLPQGATFNAAASTAGWEEVTPGVYRLAIGALAGNATGTATFAVTVDSIASAGLEALQTSVVIGDDNANGADLNPANNTATDSNVLVAAPDLSVTITDNSATSTPGSLVSYVLSYANNGTQGASGVVLHQILPVGTVFNAAASTAGWIEIAPGLYQLPVGSLAGAATGTATFAVTVVNPAASGLETLSATAIITDDGTNGADLNPANNLATDTSTVIAAPDLAVTITDGITSTIPGSLVSYVLNYANNGTQGAEGVYLTQTLPAGTTFNAAASTAGWVETEPGIYRFNVGALAGTETGSATFAVTVIDTVASGLETLQTAVSIADNALNGADLNPDDNIVMDSNTLIAAPDLSVTITDSTGSTTPGSLVSYVLQYRNSGTQAADGVFLTQTVPAGTVFSPVASSPGWVEVSPGVYRYDVGSLAGGGGNGSVNFAVTVTSPAASGLDTLQATVSIADDAANGADLNLADNTATDTNTLVAAPDLSVTITDSITSTTPGSLVSYVLNYANTGTQGAAGVFMTQTLPVGTSFNATASTPGWVETAPGVYRLAIGSLAGAGTGSATFAVDVLDPAASGIETLQTTATIADDSTNGADLNPANNTATDSNALDAAPDLSVTITDNLTSTTPGSLVSYVLNYANTGTQGAMGVFLTQTLPLGTVFSAAESTAGWVETTPGVYRLDIGSLAGNGTGTATFAVTVTSPAAAGLHALQTSATIADDAANGADLNLANNTATDSNTLDAVPDLSVTITDNLTSTTPGSLVSYVLNYANTGTQGAMGVFLTQTLPLGTVFSAAESTAGWVETTPGVYRLDIGSLAGNGTGTATFAVTVTSPAAAGLHALQTSATIADDAANGADLNPANNTATDSNTLDAAPDLSVTITDNLTSTTPGSLVSYVLNYANTGTQGAEGVFLTQTLPLGTLFNAAASTDGWIETSPGVYRLDIGSLAGNGTGTATFAVTVTGPAASGLHALHTSASIADDAANGTDLNPANNTATDSNILDAAPDLSVTITDNLTSTTPGSLVSYVLNYANNGTQGAEGVFLTQTLPLGTVFNAAASTAGWVQTAPGVYRLAIGSLDGSATGTATFVVAVTNPAVSGLETLQTTATIADDSANGVDLNAANNTATDSNTLVAAPDLAVTITDGITNTTPGSLVTYTLTYANNGNQNADEVVLTQTLPIGTTFNAAASTAGWVETSPGVYQLSIGALAGNGTGTATFAVTVINPAAAGLNALQTSASIADNGANGADLTPTDNTATDSNTLTAAPDLTVSVTDNGGLVAPGGIVVYVISYGNVGTQGATGVYLTETLPAYTSFDALQSTAGWVQVSPGVFRFDLNSVEAGAQGTVNFAVRVEDPITPGIREIGNTVTIVDDTSNGADLTPADNTGTDNTPLLLVDLQIRSSNGVTEIVPGGVVSYVLTYGNAGTQTASGVVITETLPAGTVFNAAASTAGWVEIAPGIYAYTVGELSSEGAGEVTFAVTVVDPATAGREVILNSVAIADNGAHGPDFAPGDNSASESDVLTANPDLRLAISDGDARARQGGLLTYTLTYSNAGNQDATGVVLTQALPVGTVFVPGSSTAGWVETAPNSGVYQLQVGALAAAAGDQSAVFTVRVVSALPAGQTSIEANAMISDDAANGADLQPGDNTASDSASVYKGIIAVTRGRDGSYPSKPALEVPLVRVFDVATGLEQFSFMAFDAKYKQGVRVAVGDVNGDGYDDIVVAAVGNKAIRVFDGLTGEQMSGPIGEFRAFSAKSAQNLFVAVGDLNGDGHADITVARGKKIQSFDGETGEVLRTFDLPRMSGAVRIAAGDINGDGVMDIVASQQQGGTRTVAFDGATAEVLHDFNLAKKSPNGAYVAVGDINGDGNADIITSHLAKGKQSAVVQAFDGVTGVLLKSFTPYTGSRFQTVRVGVADVNFDGIVDIIAAASDRSGGNVQIFDGATLAPITDGIVFDNFPPVNLHLAGTARLSSAQLVQPPLPV